MPQSDVAFQSWRLAEQSASFSYDLLTNLIVPRPIAFVSTVSEAGEPNLAPFSFFMLGGVEPPSVIFCPVRGQGGRKKVSLQNVEATGEFVVNLVTREMAEMMNSTAVPSPVESEKWGISGLTPVASSLVRPARVAESPVQLECRSFQIVEHGQSSYVIGEVLEAHVATELWHDGKIARFDPIARLGGSNYMDLDGGKVFEMQRPVPADDPS